MAYPGFQRGVCLRSGPIQKVGGGASGPDIRKVGGGGGRCASGPIYEKGGGGRGRFRSDIRNRGGYRNSEGGGVQHEK